MSENLFNEELGRMKSLFSYKKGKVISEQTMNNVPSNDGFSKFPCLSGLKTSKVATGTNIDGPTKLGVEFKTSGGRYSFSSDGSLWSYGTKYGTFRCGAKPNTIIITVNGKDSILDLKNLPK